MFNLITFDRSWRRFGVGVVALLPTGASGISAEKRELGPAACFAARPSWGLVGLFNEILITVAGDDNRTAVKLSTLQPIVSYPLQHGWSVGASDMTFVHDRKQGRFTSLPLGQKAV